MEVLKMLLGITDDSQDTLLEYLLADAESLVLGYCKIESAPPQLESVIPAIAADMYREKGYGAQDAPEYVKSVSEGERSVTMERINPADYDSFLFSYKPRLDKFVSRKGRVPSDYDSI